MNLDISYSSCIIRIVLPSPQEEEHAFLCGVMKQNSFVGKTEVLAAATPRTAVPELPGLMIHRGLLVSWGSGAAEQSWILPGW